jgi:small conductance mechanosensitive channel
MLTLLPTLAHLFAQAAAQDGGASQTPAVDVKVELTLAERAEQMFEDVLPNLVAGLVILVLGFLVVKMVAGGLRRGLGRSKLDTALQRFFVNMASVALKIMVVFAAVQRMGVETASFVAVLAAAGFAVGFALQGSLSNFAAGVMILIFRPFREGEFVELAGVSGTVAEIGLFATVLNTPQNRRVIIANGNVIGSTITNASANGTLRVDMTFGIGYDDDIGKAMGILQELLEADERVLKDPAPTIAVVGHGESSVDLVCRPFTKTSDHWGVWFDMHRKVKESFDAEGISIPYPQRDVHMHQASA